MIAIALLTTKRLCLLLIFGVNLIAFAIPASARQEMAIAKITPGMTSANVTTALGTPIRTTKLGGGFLKVRFQYDAMTIDFDEDMLVAGIESSNKQYCFNGWLCPGLSRAEVSARMPRAKFVPSKEGETLTINGDSCWASIESVRKAIQSVSIRCQP